MKLKNKRLFQAQFGVNDCKSGRLCEKTKNHAHVSSKCDHIELFIAKNMILSMTEYFFWEKITFLPIAKIG